MKQLSLSFRFFCTGTNPRFLLLPIIICLNKNKQYLIFLIYIIKLFLRSCIWLVCLFVCLGVCLFVSNKRQNGWTDRAQIFCGTSKDPREGLWMIKISNICLHQNSIVIKFLKILKIREIFCENTRIIFVLFYDVHKENMFTINLGDWREAPSNARKKGAKRLEFLVS